MLELLALHNKEREIAARPKYILLYQQAKAFAMKDNIQSLKVKGHEEQAERESLWKPAKTMVEFEK